MSSGRWRIARLEGKPHRLADGTAPARLVLVVRWRGPGDARARRYRFALGLDDTRENRRRWTARMHQIEREIVTGSFEPARWFARNAGAAGAAAPLTLGTLGRRWLEELAGAGMAPGTREQYRLMLERHLFSDPLAAVGFANLHDGHLKEFRARLQAAGALKVSTVNKIFARVRTLVNLAFARGLIARPQSPAALVKNLPMAPREVDPFSPDELLRIFQAAREAQQRTLYILLALTGLRPSEALGLGWGDVDLERGAIAVRRQVTEEGGLTDRLKTVRSRREVGLFAPARAALAAQRERTLLKGELVFCNARGGALLERSQGESPWRRTLLRAGVPHRPLYNLRHSYTSLMLSAGRPIQWVAHQLGHAGVRKIDEVYGRWSRTPEAQMLDLEGFFAAVSASLAAKSAPSWPQPGGAGRKWAKSLSEVPRPGVEPGLAEAQSKTGTGRNPQGGRE
jgi:integrase